MGSSGGCWWILSFGVLSLAMSLLIKVSSGALAGWKNTPTQYHIQTDEGERYFRYQTYNGQFRKERRLDDGTVIGSYGWVDPTGYLRMTNYIADTKGYRVVKEMTKFVGTNAIQNEEKKKRKYIKNKVPYNKAKVVFTSPPTRKTPIGFKSSYTSRKSNKLYFIPSESKTTEVTVAPLKSDARSTSRFGNSRPEPGTSKKITVNPVARGAHQNEKNDVFKKYATPLKPETSSGFIYKIPNQYHKEETERDGSRTGSFGYVDPFGIRRVIKYNAGQSGFRHSKDFSFVGKQY